MRLLQPAVEAQLFLAFIQHSQEQVAIEIFHARSRADIAEEELVP
jgi:hypothetical protein